MAQMVECSLIMWEVLGSKPSWVCVFVVVDVGAIFFYLQKMMQKSFFQKTNYQATWVLWYRCLIWILLLLLCQTTEKISFCLKWKKGHNSPKFQNYYKMIVSASWWVLTDIVVKKLAPYVKQCDLYRADKHTDIHTAKKLRKVYFTFLFCYFISY